MNKHFRSLSSLAVLIALLSQSALASFDRGREARVGRERQESGEEVAGPKIVRWKGLIRDDESSHTTLHDHSLRFVRLDDEEQDTFKVVDSPELVKLHHEGERNYLVEIEAEKTARFLFWGGNLIVKNFRVIQELGERIPHQVPAEKREHAVGGRR